MPADAEHSREREPMHQHSFSDSGRLSVPMWDSSDPDRAPPPLPLNPQNPNASPTRPNTSATVAAAAQALADRARESAGRVSPYTINPLPERTSEKSPTRSPQHKRLQSLQTGTVRDAKASLENGRPATPISGRDYFPSSSDRSPSRAETPTQSASSSKEMLENTPVLRPSARQMVRQGTPPSATMLAIQNMPFRDTDSPFTTPLGDITNSSFISNKAATCLTPQANESIETQIHNLTVIATALQTEMTALSRRSKDNATDLIGLKEATKTRDEDIRKSLRELVSNARASESNFLGPPSRTDLPRASSALGLASSRGDGKTFGSPTFHKSISLPRIPSLTNLDRAGGEYDRPSSPVHFTVEGAASVAMLEKILREMVTKEGQEHLLATLSDILEKSTSRSTDSTKAVAAKIDELAEMLNGSDHTRNIKALVKHNSSVSHTKENAAANIDFDAEGSVISVSGERDMNDMAATRKPAAASFVSDDMIRLLQRVKDSVAQTGGMTGEVKSLVRELRGEVLGMGRELGRKVEKASVAKPPQQDAEEGPTREELAQIVQDGLAELREQMDQLIETKRRQSSGSTISRNTVDSTEVYAVVKHALAEHGLDETRSLQGTSAPFDQEAILNAVKEAYEAYKPEIELQQFGLERDEVLQCLKEGLEDYQSAKEDRQVPAINREDIMEAVQDAMQHFTPPSPMTDASEIKDEVLTAVRQGLQTYMLQDNKVPEWKPDDVLRVNIVQAIREEMADIRKEGAREIEISRDDLFQAVKAGLDSTQTPFGGYGDQVLNSLHEIVEGMRSEFKQYSEAGGKDTEQVLDAMKDNLEVLRGEIESYVDRAQDVTGKDEILDAFKDGLETLRSNVEVYVTRNSDSTADRSDIATYIKAEFDRLHETIAAQSETRDLSSNDKSTDTSELLVAFSAGFNDLKSSLGRNGLESSSEDVLDAVKQEFEELREAVLHGNAEHKDEILESLQDSLGGLHARLGSRDIGSGADVASVIKEEFAAMRDSHSAPLVLSGSAPNQEDMLDAIRDTVDAIRVQIAADQQEAAGESLGAIKEHLEVLQDKFGQSLVPRMSPVDKEDIRETIRNGLESIQLARGLNGNEDAGDETVESIRHELEQLRQSINSTMVPSGRATTEPDTMEQVRVGLDELRAQIDTKLDQAMQPSGAQSEVLETLNDGLDNLRMDIAKMADKPVDMTVSYEILDTLKDGLSGVRADLDRLRPGSAGMKNGDVVLVGAQDDSLARNLADNAVPATNIEKQDLEKLEVMLTRLQIKVEAMDQNIGGMPMQADPAESAEMRTGIINLEAAVREIQAGVASLANQPRPSETPGVSKDDADAIETLLINAKAKIDERILPSLDAAATKNHLDAVETIVRMTNEAVEALTSSLDSNTASKDDVAAMGILMQETSSSLNTLKESLGSNSDHVRKSDIESLEIACQSIKATVDVALASEMLPSKSDLEDLSTILYQFKLSHDALKERYENDVGVTAKAFDDRRDEALKIVDQIGELKVFVEECKDELKSRVKKGNQDLRALDEILEGIEEKIEESPNAILEVQNLMQTVVHEFETAHGSLESLKTTQEERSNALLTKHDEHRTAIEDLTQKLHDGLGAVMTRHDELQEATTSATQTVTDRAIQQEELLSGSRAVAEELKVTIDTLGASITAITPALAEATDKMGGDAKTVFNKVHDMYNRLDDNHMDNKTEHQLTRNEVLKSVTNLSGELNIAHPKFMELLSNLAAIVGQHFEHFTHFQEVFQEHGQTSRAGFEEVKSNIAALPAPRLEAPPQTYASEDSRLHGKLDELLSAVKASDRSSSHSAGARPAEDHRQLITAAAEISAFVAFQTKILSAQHENKAKEASQAAIDLSRCLSEREELDANIIGLQDEKKVVAADVARLSTEREALVSQKSRLAAEVSSLETALAIRREELQMMDARADALERRIIDGVMDHSRALLIAKAPRGLPNMNLKRVASNASNATVSTATPSSIGAAGLGMALKNRSAPKRSASSSNPAARRIASLNQITNNIPTGGKGVPALSGTNKAGLANLKRSQSVKNPVKKVAARNTSWAGHGSIADYDKENGALTEESEEEDDEGQEQQGQMTLHRPVSQAETRVSHSTRQSSYGTGPSEYTYATSSFVGGTDLDGRTSLGSIVHSTGGGVGGSSLDDSINEEDEDAGVGNDVPAEEARVMAEHGSSEAQLHQVGSGRKPLAIRPPGGYDSGLGSDLPTAALSSTMSGDYFAKAKVGKQ